MSCFTICDNADCIGNEGSNEMFGVPHEVAEILTENGYDSMIDDLCDECVEILAEDDNVNTLIGFDEDDYLVAADSEECVATLKDKFLSET